MRTGTLPEEDEEQELIENIRDVTLGLNEMYISCAANPESEDYTWLTTTDIRRFTINDLGELEMGGQGEILEVYFTMRHTVPYQIWLDVVGVPPSRYSLAHPKQIRADWKVEILFPPDNENRSYTVSIEGDTLNESIKSSFFRLITSLNLVVRETPVTIEYEIPLLVYGHLQSRTLLQKIERETNTTIELVADSPAIRVAGTADNIFKVRQSILDISMLRVSLRISNNEQTRERIMALPLNEKISRSIEPSCIEGSVIITFEGPESLAMDMCVLISRTRDINSGELRQEYYGEWMRTGGLQYQV